MEPSVHTDMASYGRNGKFYKKFCHFIGINGVICTSEIYFISVPFQVLNLFFLSLTNIVNLTSKLSLDQTLAGAPNGTASFKFIPLGTFLIAGVRRWQNIFG